MPRVTYVSADESDRKTIDGALGETAMQAAVENGVDGIVAECGGELMCSTCHVYVDAEWADKVGSPSSDYEGEMLNETASERKPTSRLSCQIRLTEELDGLVLHLPEEQQ